MVRTAAFMFLNSRAQDERICVLSEAALAGEAPAATWPKQKTMITYRKLLNITKSESFTRARVMAICLPSGETTYAAIDSGSVLKWVS